MHQPELIPQIAPLQLLPQARDESITGEAGPVGVEIRRMKVCHGELLPPQDTVEQQLRENPEISAASDGERTTRKFPVSHWETQQLAA